MAVQHPPPPSCKFCQRHIFVGLTMIDHKVTYYVNAIACLVHALKIGLVLQLLVVACVLIQIRKVIPCLDQDKARTSNVRHRWGTL